jgi:hypothetical protein
MKPTGSPRGGQGLIQCDLLDDLEVFLASHNKVGVAFVVAMELLENFQGLGVATIGHEPSRGLGDDKEHSSDADGGECGEDLRDAPILRNVRKEKKIGPTAYQRVLIKIKTVLDPRCERVAL